MNLYYKQSFMVQSIMSLYIYLSSCVSNFKYLQGDCCGCDRMVVGFTSIYAIRAYHRYRCEFKLCDKVYQRLAASQWFYPGTAVSSTNKTDCDDITEILLKMA